MPSNTRIILVHGIHAAEGQSHIGLLVPHLEALGLEVIRFEYGFLSALRARWANPGIAKRLAAIARPEDVVVCHSNGAAVTWLACEKYGLSLNGVALINPALDSDKLLRNCGWMDVYHNPGDDIVWLSKWLINHAWGSMGRDGCTYKPLRGFELANYGVTNIDCGNTEGMPKIDGHLEFFSTAKIARWAQYLGLRIRHHLEKSK